MHFQHCLLTRFNVRLPKFARDASVSHPGLDEGWLERRFELFENRCFPSVKSQTSRSFRWLVFMDPETPCRFLDIMERLCRDLPQLHVILTHEEVEKSALKWMNEHADGADLRITTRFDNDDAIHPRFMEKVGRIASKRVRRSGDREFFVSLPIGCSETDGDYYVQRFRFNPFVSLVAPTTHEKTVLGFEHTSIARVAPVVLSYSRPMWCQVIHGENVCNTARGIYVPLSGGALFPGIPRVSSSTSVKDILPKIWRSSRGYLFGR